MLKAAFSLGQSALALYYDHEEPEKEVEDSYNINPLPYIIGTESFIDSPDAGLAGGEHGNFDEGQDPYDDNGNGDFDAPGAGEPSTGSRARRHSSADEGDNDEWGSASGDDETDTGAGANMVKVSEHPTYEPYFKMLKVGYHHPLLQIKCQQKV